MLIFFICLGYHIIHLWLTNPRTKWFYTNCWCWKSAKGINDKQLPKNFNLFVLMKKVIQEKKEILNTIGRSRERKKISRERSSGIYFWKINRMNPSNYPAHLFIDAVDITDTWHYSLDNLADSKSRYVYLKVCSLCLLVLLCYDINIFNYALMMSLK